MTANHHLDEATLMSCAAGTLPPALAVVAMSHIALCPACREGMADAESIGGLLLASLAPTALAREPRLPDDAGVRVREPRRVGRVADGEVPLPLARLVGPSLDAIRWRPLGIGIWHHRVALGGAGSGALRLIKASPGRDVPAHGHNGSELTLVLRGAYHDELGRFGAGDVADLDESVEHHPVADSMGCICVLASERPARFHGVLARLLQPLTGL